MYYLLIDLLKCKKKKKKRLWIIKQMVFKNWLLVLFTLKKKRGCSVMEANYLTHSVIAPNSYGSQTC